MGKTRSISGDCLSCLSGKWPLNYDGRNSTPPIYACMAGLARFDGGRLSGIGTNNPLLKKVNSTD